jgi:hypothetical protein
MRLLLRRVGVYPAATRIVVAGCKGIVMSRLPPLTLDEMTPEQRRIHDEFMAAHNGRVAITHLTWLRSPELTSHIAKFGPYVRH